MIELEQLQHLVAVSEHGTISAAAEAQHLSQPALTRSLQRLEAELGVTLFDRKKNRAVLNAVGELAVNKARILLGTAEDMAIELRLFAGRMATVAIGSCGPAPMWDLAAELFERFPGKAISSELGETEALIEGLLQGQYRLILTDRFLEQEGVLCKQYSEERLYIALPPSHPLSGKTSISLSELEGQSVLQFRDMGVWRSYMEKQPHPHYLVQNDLEALIELIQASDLPCFSSNLTVFRFRAMNTRISIPLSDKEAVVSFYLCARESDSELFHQLC